MDVCGRTGPGWLLLSLLLLSRSAPGASFRQNQQDAEFTFLLPPGAAECFYTAGGRGLEVEYQVQLQLPVSRPVELKAHQCLSRGRSYDVAMEINQGGCVWFLFIITYQIPGSCRCRHGDVSCWCRHGDVCVPASPGDLWSWFGRRLLAPLPARSPADLGVAAV